MPGLKLRMPPSGTGSLKPGREENGFGVFLFKGGRIVRDVFRPELVRTKNDTIYLAGVK